MKQLETDFDSSSRALSDFVAAGDEAIADPEEGFHEKIVDMVEDARRVHEIHRVFAYNGRRCACVLSCMCACVDVPQGVFSDSVVVIVL